MPLLFTAQIRPLADSDSIHELTSLLHRAYARLGAMGLNYTAVDQTPEVTATRIDGGFCFVAEHQGVLIGTIVAQPTHAHHSCRHFTRAGVASAHQFAVDPRHQGEGLGRSLLDAAERWAVQRGYREMLLDTAEPAYHLVDLYRRSGYRPIDFAQWSGKTYRSVILSKQLSEIGAELPTP